MLFANFAASTQSKGKIHYIVSIIQPVYLALYLENPDK